MKRLFCLKHPWCNPSWKGSIITYIEYFIITSKRLINLDAAGNNVERSDSTFNEQKEK